MDIYLLKQINSYALKWFWSDTLAVFFAKYFEYILIFCLLLFLIAGFKKYRQPTAGQPKAEKMVFQAFLAAILARFVVVDFIRWIWPRSRPFVEHNVNLLLSKANEASFPSGHAAFYFALSTIIYFHNKKIGILFFAASFLITISRVFCGIHWPSDILAGAIVGILSGWLVNKIYKKIREEKPA